MNDQMPLVVIGAGNMARAILGGAIDAGVVGDEFVAVDPDPEARGAFDHAVGTAEAGLAWVREREQRPGDGQVMLAVKPQLLGAVGAELRAAMAGEDRVVISILAGKPSATVREAIGGGRIVRVMPNLPARVRRGVSAIAVGAGAEPGDDAFARELFESVGRVEIVQESMMDAFTAVAGSGPAYVCYLAEAMIDAAVELGFEHEQAVRIVRGVVLGSGELLAQSGEAPRAMRAAVTSKGGTTAAATDVLDKRGVLGAVVDAIHAARHRGAELARSE